MDFINACYIHCCIPLNVLKGDINPTIKDSNGNVTESNNYRPVMQSSVILKIIEKHILMILEEKITFNFRQFGFLKGCSTTDACLVVKEVVQPYMKKKGSAYSAFIDLSKAFDKVNHFKMGNILLQRAVPPDIVILIMSYLRNQSARVCWDNSKGSYYFINRGVRQGGILSPFLFKLYIDNVIDELSSKEIGCRLSFLRLNILAYADDIVLLSDSLDNLNFLYELLIRKFQDLELVVNRKKSKCMIFCKSKCNEVNEVILGGDRLEVVSKYKYLGHIITNDCTDNEDIKFRLREFYSKFNTVFRNFIKVDIQTFMFLFKSYCLPCYGLNIWNVVEQKNKQIFKVFEGAFSNALKKMVGAPIFSSSHVVADKCKQLLFKHHLAVLQIRYIKRIMKSNNLITKICKQFIKQGYFCSSVAKWFEEDYELDLWSNDLDVVQARIEWVQRHEDRRRICVYYGI